GAGAQPRAGGRGGRGTASAAGEVGGPRLALDRPVEDGGVHHRGDCRPARLCAADRGTPVAADPHPVGAGERVMSDSSHSESRLPPSWSPAIALQVDEICLRFEEAWRTAPKQPPILEHYLEGVEEPGREKLLHELLAVELAY